VERHASKSFGAAARVEGGDEQLIRALYSEFAGPLLGHLLPLTGNDRQWAEDVVQETLFRAWRNAGRLARDRGLLWAWLLTVARRIVIDGRRRRSARPREVEPAALDIVPIPDQSEQTLSAMVVSDALRRLSREHREAIVETYFHHRSINEAAQILGIRPGTVKSRVYYGLRALRDALQDEG
jgi:RNA polymerase sigma-70 factor (ECF subfamily)